MERLQVPFTQEDPAIDEDAVKRGNGAPMATVQELARQKAYAVWQRHPENTVIGCDQVAVVDETVLDKPGNASNAIAQLHRLRAREHQLLTAVSIMRSSGDTLPPLQIEFVDVTRLVMRNLSDDEIHRYVQKEQPFDCAGSYKIESLGISLFERIDTHDQTAIIGLPMLQLSAELRKLGIAVP